MQRKKIVILFASVVFGVAAAFIARVYQRQHVIQKEIANEVIRFHILANSDSRQDQKIKLEVKETMIPVINQLTEQAENLSETRALLQDQGSLEYLREKAQSEVLKAGGDQEVSIQYGKSAFPVKNYGDYTFPAGNYEALQIKIGEARGHNWWCMLYPSLCFADALQPTLEKGADKLKKVLSDDAYLWILEKEKVNFTFRWF